LNEEITHDQAFDALDASWNRTIASSLDSPSDARPDNGSDAINAHANFAVMEWANLIPPEQWAIYCSAIEAIRLTGCGFLLGGAFGLAVYTGRLRNTKDLDLFVLPNERHAVIEALTKHGFEDFYERLPYDRGWIYRSMRDDTIVDVIWGMPNRRAEVDDLWFKYAKPIQIFEQSLYAISAEELLWIKLYVLQRDRCDWPDLINLLNATGPGLKWNRVLDRLADDAPLLRGLLSIFAWLCPARARELAPEVFRWLELPPPNAGNTPVCDEWRIRLLDTRPWFAALQPSDAPMKL
jgi:hypothetical protein